MTSRAATDPAAFPDRGREAPQRIRHRPRHHDQDLDPAGPRSLLNRLAFGFYLLVLIWAPVPLGSNRVWAWSLLELMVYGLGALVLLGWALWPATFPLRRLLRHRWLLVLFGVHLLFLLAQLMPLPRELAGLFGSNRLAWHDSGGLLWESGRIPLTASVSASLDQFFKQQAYLVIFCLSLLLVDSRKRFFILGYALILVALLEVLHGVSSYYMRDSFPFWRPVWLGHDWVSGTFMNKNHFAANLSFAIGLLLGFYLYFLVRDGGRRYSRGLLERLANLAAGLLEPRNLHLGLLLVLLSGFLLSQSRGALLGLGGAAVLLLGYGMLIQGRHSPEGRVLSYLGLTTLIATVWLSATGIFTRLLSLADPENYRVLVWERMLPLVREHWLVGTGNGSFEYLFTRVKTTELAANAYDFAHNDHLQLLLEQGVLGALPWYGALLLAGWRMFHIYRRHGERQGRQRLLLGVMVACLAFFLHGFVDFNFHIPANALWFYALLGAGLAIVQWPDGQSWPSRHLQM